MEYTPGSRVSIAVAAAAAAADDDDDELPPPPDDAPGELLEAETLFDLVGRA